MHSTFAGRCLGAACALASSALLAGSAAAADGVRVYGVADMYIAVNNDGGKTNAAVQSGGASASLVGLTGEETLENGLAASFKLEAGVLMDDGTSAPPGGGDSYLFQRESWVSLRSRDLGEIRLGRQYTPYFMTFILVDPTHMSLGGAIGNFCWPGDDSLLGGAFGASDISRRDNALLYISPDFGGFTAELMASTGEQKRSDGSSSSSRGNSYSAAVQYAQGPLLLRASWLFDKLLPSDALGGQAHDQYIVLGGSYDAGFAAPSLMAVKKFSSAESAASPEVWAVQAAAAIPAAGGTLLASAAFLKNESEADADAWSLGLRYDYPLSKRTKVYCGASAVINEDNSDHVVIPGPGSSAPFFSEGTGRGAQQFFAGVSHAF